MFNSSKSNRDWLMIYLILLGYFFSLGQTWYIVREILRNRKFGIFPYQFDHHK